MRDHDADTHGIDEKTARLKALRHAKEAADAAAKPKMKNVGLGKWKISQ